MKNITAITIIALMSLPTCLCLYLWPVTTGHAARHAAPERYYQQQWCSEHHGRAEVTLPDRTRCDCLTATHAVEVDFAPKWTEAIGQSLYYALQTGRRAGIVLIIEREQDRKCWIRLNSVIMHYKLPIDTWAAGDGK